MPEVVIGSPVRFEGPPVPRYGIARCCGRLFQYTLMVVGGRRVRWMPHVCGDESRWYQP